MHHYVLLVHVYVHMYMGEVCVCMNVCECVYMQVRQ